MTKATVFLGMVVAFLGAQATAQHSSQFNTFARDQEQVLQVETKWTAAIAGKQPAALAALLADDYQCTAPDGKTLSKAEEMALLKSADLKLESFATQDLKVRVYVGGVIVTGRATAKGKYKDTELDGDYLFTDIFELQKGEWRAVWRQLTKVQAEKAEGKPSPQP